MIFFDDQPPTLEIGYKISIVSLVMTHIATKKQALGLSINVSLIPNFQGVFQENVLNIVLICSCRLLGDSLERSDHSFSLPREVLYIRPTLIPH